MSSTYDVVADEYFEIIDRKFAALCELNDRRRPVSEAHARPDLRVIAADKTKALFHAWTGNGAALAARRAALAPFEAEENALRDRFDAELNSCLERHGWPEHLLLGTLDTRIG